jgi:cell fate (sporulation/competence/biofilm development) regulator YlbF (YheA/YmcA/DUF963 family)
MVSNIYLLAGELKDLLDNDERIIRLNKLENELNNNEEVMTLSYQKDLAVSAYSDALNHFANNSEEIKKYQHELFLKKEALDNHPLVKSYLKAYSEVRDLYFQINEILFNDLSLHQKEKRILR